MTGAHPFDFSVPRPPGAEGGQGPGPGVTTPFTEATPPSPAPPDVWAPTDMPRVVDGIVVPASSAVAQEGRPIYAPAGQVKSVSETARAVGFYSTAGQWVLLWVGDDPAERERALRTVLYDLASWTHR